MALKKIFLLIPSLLLLNLFSGCFWVHDTEDQIPEQILYSSSFESQSDTIGWKGHCWMEFSEEVSLQAGNQSLMVSCGCIGPWAYLDLPPVEEDSKLILSCWAKKYGLGAYVGMSLGEDFPDPVLIHVQDTLWQFFEAADTLFCPAGEQVRLHLSAGGIAAGSIYVDLLEVKRVD